MNQTSGKRYRSTVTKVDLPRGTLVEHDFPRIDYADAYQARLPVGLAVDVDSIARSIFLSVPRWIHTLMALRNRIVAPIGLKTPDWDAIESEEPRFQPGSSIRGFRVIERTEDEIVFGEEDSHLDFRLSILRQTAGDDIQVILSTVVRFNNWIGRAYFLPVKPLHEIIVPAMIREAIQTLVSSETR